MWRFHCPSRGSNDPSEVGSPPAPPSPPFSLTAPGGGGENYWFEGVMVAFAPRAGFLTALGPAFPRAAVPTSCSSGGGLHADHLTGGCQLETCVRAFSSHHTAYSLCLPRSPPQPGTASSRAHTRA